MGKKQRRYTAKTGDVALYKNRTTKTHQNSQQQDDDPWEKKFLAFEGKQKEENDVLEQEEEAVMDLGLNFNNDDDVSTTSSSSNDEESSFSAAEQEQHDDDDDLSSTTSNVQHEEEEHVLDWGHSKSQYYHGDTADLEIGQEQQDAYEEEEAAQLVLMARFQEMDEEDFFLSKQSVPENQNAKPEKPSGLVIANPKQQQQQHKLLEMQYPQELSLLEHFSQVVANYQQQTKPVTSTLLTSDDETREEIGTTCMGLQYLVTKSMLQASIGLHVALYLLLQAHHQEQQNEDTTTIQDFVSHNQKTAALVSHHPIGIQLKQYNDMLQKLQDRVERGNNTKQHGTTNLLEQVKNLMQAMEFMKESSDLQEPDEMQTQDQQVDAVESEEKDKEEKQPHDVTATLLQTSAAVSSFDDDNKDNVDDDDDKSMQDDSKNGEEQVARSLWNEARFGLRISQVNTTHKPDSNKNRRVSPYSFLGKNHENHHDDKDKRAFQALATTMNSMEQRLQTRKRRAASVPQEQDAVENDQVDNLNRGLAMMEAEGLLHDSDDMIGEMNPKDTNDLVESSDNDDNDFYNQVKKRSKVRKEIKDNMYKVAPKYPGMEQEVQGERSIGRTIMKNRGLVAHKSKLNRNPRVKKREQYRKALIRRKGTVRQVRTDEGHKYGGEETGIKSTLSRSRKLGV